MRADQWTAVITALSLLFLIMMTGLGLIVRITGRWTKVEDRLQAIADKMDLLIANMDHKVDKVDDRLDRHERWHDDHPWPRNAD